MHIGVIKKEFFAGFTSGFVLAALLLALHPAGVLRPRGCPLPETGALGAARLQVEHRRRLAQVVSEVSRQVARWPDAPDGKWARRLSEVAAELDPRLPRAPSLLVFPAAASSSSSSSSPPPPPSPSSSSSFSSSPSSSSSSSPLQWDFSARLPDAPLPNRSRSVCPEVYFGGRYGWPFFQHGMEAEKECQEAPPLYDVLTVLLPARRWPERRLRRVREAIAKEHRVRVIVIAEGEITVKDAADVRVIKLSGRSESDALNDAVELVETPFVFLGESLAHFSNQSSLERLVRVLDDLDHVQVAGGAARDTRGRWIHGCLQQHMANYHAKYTLGYYHSKYECMYCDDLLTPFATRTKLLRTIPFSAGLSGQAVYRDWFAKVRSAGHLAVTCPDVMFFLSDHVNMTAEDWLPMARRWALERVQAFDGQEHHFSCESLGISCSDLMSIVDSFLIPLCCLAFITDKVHRALEVAEEQQLDYELTAGTVLGAVKFGSVLPWDIDLDIFIECGNQGRWMDIAHAHLNGKGCSLKVYEADVYFSVICPKYMVEFTCHRRLSRSFLPVEYRDVPTRIEFGGRWTKAQSNPGLYCRNQYGFEVLRHAQHWRFLPAPEMGRKKGGYESAGQWKSCRNPTHHACLDRYPGDGNLPLLQPFLHP
ncbi:uncharacterized protein LOC122244658 isoform X2 [Penaeus japonicus]|uniref:uncharacterized protein LOC122244658 isoform X2 n=1 Tax=Penaeus japonicus TaxID=27405 RepID=UPI001C70BE8B|nr:uncharacterized protein LOC122244658 isoform X2 [Penaeus japonicus]